MIVVVSPANAVELVVPSCNNTVSPSSAVPPDVPKPGKVTLDVFAVIADACPDVIPVFAVLAVIALA